MSAIRLQMEVAHKRVAPTSARHGNACAKDDCSHGVSLAMVLAGCHGGIRSPTRLNVSDGTDTASIHTAFKETIHLSEAWHEWDNMKMAPAHTRLDVEAAWGPGGRQADS